MNKIITFSVIFLFFCADFAFSQTNSLKTEFQSWNEIQFILPLVKKTDKKGKSIERVTATFNGIFRYGRNDFGLVDNRYGVTVDFRLNKFITLTTSSVYRKTEPIKTRKNYETRLAIGGIISKTGRGFTFRDRNLYEYRVRNSRADTQVYRNRFLVSYSLKHKKKELFSPFISEEGYYDLRQKTWILNEFFVGITRKLTSKVSVDFAYIRADSQPVNVNGFSTSLKIKLR